MNSTTPRPVSIQLMDMEIAHDALCDLFNSIEALQNTDLWSRLPIGIRRQVCATRFIADRMSDQIGELI